MVEVLSKPAMSFVGLHSAFIHALSPEANGPTVLGPLWQQFIQRIGDIPDRVGEETYGLVYGLPLADRAHADQLEYIAAAQVRDGAEVPDGMIRYSTPAAKFAVFVHKGPISQISDTIEYAYRSWLPESGFEHAGVADVELYDDRFCPDGAEAEMEYWIPVLPGP